MKRSLTMSALLAVIPTLAMAQDAPAAIDSGNTAWLLLSSALVMLMTPGLAFFYAGMVRRRNMVATLMQNYAALAVVGVLWIMFGYSLVFTSNTPWIGTTTYFFLEGVGQEPFGTYGVPHLAFMAFQMMFAIITPALITGSLAERINFKSWILFMGLWSMLVYVPIAHWVWGPDGWILADGGLDFAGGLVVHLSSGASALVAALVLGKRNVVSQAPKPNDISMIMLGAALLWFGWFGFNAGSAIVSGGLAAHAFVTTFACAATAFIGWVIIDWVRHGKPSAVGGAIGLVVGLVIITPAAGFVTVQSALLMGLVGGILCNMIAHAVKRASHLVDDTLDVFACHGVGGILGAIMTGLFATNTVNPSVSNEGLLVGGDSTLLVANITGVVAVFAFSAIATFVILKVVKALISTRVSAEEEELGLDQTLHGEYARYNA